MTLRRDGQGKNGLGKPAACWEGVNWEEAEALPFSGYRGEIGRISEKATKAELPSFQVLRSDPIKETAWFTYAS